MNMVVTCGGGLSDRGLLSAVRRDELSTAVRHPLLEPFTQTAVKAHSRLLTRRRRGSA